MDLPGDTGPKGRSGSMSRLERSQLNSPSTVPPWRRMSGSHSLREAASRRPILLGNSVSRNTQLPEQEAENVGIFLDDLVDGPSAGVAGLRVVEQQNRAIRNGGGLQPRRHFSRMSKRHAGV